MPKLKFTQEQIAYTLKQAEGGTAVAEVCRKVGITEQTSYRWKRKFASMGVAELRRLKVFLSNSSKKKTRSSSLWSQTSRWTSTCFRRSSQYIHL